MATPMVYVICDQNCKFESMTKEQILTAIVQAVNEGTIGDIDTGFIQTIKTINGTPLRFFVGLQAEYDALTDEDKENLFAIITNDSTKEGIISYLNSLADKVESLEAQIGGNSMDYAAEFAAIRNEIAAEASARKSADATEVSTRAAADKLINDKLANAFTSFRYSKLYPQLPSVGFFCIEIETVAETIGTISCGLLHWNGALPVSSYIGSDLMLRITEDGFIKILTADTLTDITDNYKVYWSKIWG